MPINAGWENEIISFTKRILPENKTSYEKKLKKLNSHAESLKENAKKFDDLFKAIIHDENQKGKIFKEIKGKAEKLKKQHYLYCESLETQNKGVLEKVEGVIDENKTQNMTASYHIEKIMCE